MLIALQQFIEQESLFGKSDNLLVAVSGGLDSTALVYLLDRLGYDFAIAHCNFQLRGSESDEDALFVKQMAFSLSKIYHETSFATKEESLAGESTQMTARRLRYSWFEKLRAAFNYDYLLTAHHLDDNLETLLLNLLRGTGLKGLGGIPLRQDHLRRPLLGFNRSQISQWMLEEGISHRIDSSNQKNDYLRNRIRHHLLPVMYDLQPHLAKVMNHNFQNIRAGLAYYQSITQQALKEVTLNNKQGWQIKKEELKENPFGELLLYELLSKKGFDKEQIRQAWVAKTGTILNALNTRLLISDQYWRLETKTNSSLDQIVVASIPAKLAIGEGISLSIKEVPRPDQLKLPADQAYLSADDLEWPLSIRYWQEGDRFEPFGMQGKTQKLQDFFINAKIDRLERAKLPLLVNGNGDIIWIMGHRISHKYRVLAQTKTLIYAQLEQND